MARDTKHREDKKRWEDLSPATRGAILAVGLVDVGLRALSLADLVKRPQDQVRGPKSAWAVALAVVNSVGLLPAAYLICGRRAD